VRPGDAAQAIGSFRSVKRRMEQVARVGGITVYDDFAHHPTAVRQTLEALRTADGGRLICILEPRSNTMRMGINRDALREALSLADAAYVYQAVEMQWDAHELESETVVTVNDTGAIIERVCRNSRPGDRVVIMSNGGFENLTRRLVEHLSR
jgi:UDP-N-acetylmuramate: L-alanyl-gamma-D-glutamyl-meso-diaminopimelate ligase